MSPTEVAAAVCVDTDRGLDSATAHDLLEQYGPNEIARQAGPSFVQRLGNQFIDPLVGLLLAAIAVSLIAWSFDDDSTLPLEAIVIALIVLANAAIGLWQEGKASKAVEALQALTAAHSNVVRDGHVVRVPTAEVVPGDVVTVAEGDVVGYDARVVHAASLEMNEAALTGESQSVEKSPEQQLVKVLVADRSSMLHSATSVARGRGRAIVVSTGQATEVGRIASLLDATEQEPTPLQRQIQQLGRVLGVAVVVLAVVVVAAIMLTSDVDTAEEALDALLVAVSLAVAAVPEGLPAIMTIVLALGVQRMSRRGAIVKRLLSVETLGSASVICTDKTGTLTRNEMTVVSVASCAGVSTLGGVGFSPVGVLELGEKVPLREVEELLRGAAAACDATIQAVDGDWCVAGDPTEIALVVASAKIRASRSDNRETRIDEVPFDADRKMMSVLLECRDGQNAARFVQYTKGAPDMLLERCVTEMCDESPRSITQARRLEIASEVDRFADQGLRTLGVARQEFTARPTVFDDTMETGLEWLGVAAMSDPPRPEAADVISRARAAGIRTIMLTGDHPRTASAIGEALGLNRAARPVSGVDLAPHGDEETPMGDLIDSTDVFARVAPDHKLQLVNALQQRGEVVAMTGDGVNDAPALRRADIGVAMGGVGTDVAREAADMVLTDDDFATIITAVEEGRNIFADIAKFLRYLLASNAGEVLVMVIGVLAAGLLGLQVDDGLAVPLLATQILWINLVTDSALAFALGVDPSVEDHMAQSPRALGAPIVDRAMWLTIFLVGITTACAGLIALDLELAGGLLGGDGDIDSARTMLFTTVVLAQVFNAFNARSDRVSAFVRPFDNRLLWLAVAATVGLQIAVVHFNFLNRAFDTTALTLGQWGTCWILASSVLFVNEVRKVVSRRVRYRQGRMPLVTG